MSLPSAPLLFLSALLPSFSCLPLSLFFLFLLLKNCLFLAGPGLHCCLGFSLVVVSRGSSLVLVCGLLITVASFVSEHGLWGVQASGLAAASLWSTGSIVAARRLSRSAACGVFPDQGSSSYLLQWQGDSLPLNHWGSPSLPPLLKKQTWILRYIFSPILCFFPIKQHIMNIFTI